MRQKTIQLTEEEFNELFEIASKMERIRREVARLRREITQLQNTLIYLTGQKDYILKKLGEKYNFKPTGKFQLDTDTKSIVIMGDSVEQEEEENNT